MDITEPVIAAAMQMIATARWNLTLDQFLERLDAPNDEYWRSKFGDWVIMTDQLARFDSSTLAKLCRPYEAAVVPDHRRGELESSTYGLEASQ